MSETTQDPAATQRPAPSAGDLPEQMTAVVVHGPQDYRLTQKPVPQPGPGDLLIAVESVGVCASDLKCYHGAAKFWGDENRAPYVTAPVTPGHEIVGTVVRGESEALAAQGVAHGDRIVVEQIVPCGECRYCRNGAYWMCGPHDMFGFRHHDGGMAEYMVVPPNARVHRVSKELAPQHAAFAEPLSCALHAVERADITFNDVVVVAGAGPIGLGAIAGVRQKNPLRVIALDMVDSKLELARACGADLTINIAEQDPGEVIRDLTDGYGADVYIEATGHPSAVRQGVNLLRKLGTFVEYSVFKDDVTVDWSIISDDKELDVLGAHLGPHCWPAAIKLLESGALPMERICTDQFPLDRFQEALDLVADSGGASVKVSLLP